MKHTTLSRFASLAASAALALSLAACGSTSRSTYSAAVSNDTAALSSQDAGDYEYYSAESAAAGESSSFSSDDLTSSMLDPSTVESSRKIVYNASVRMETTDYDTTRAALQEAVTAANGYLESTDQGGSITAEYVDVEARLKALNDQRDRLNALADKAETTADLLEIESQLSDVQYQLESYTGQMRLMDNQVRYSTVDISLQEVRVLTPTATTFGEKFVEAVTSGWRGFVDGAEDLILVVVYLWPVVLIVLAILLVARPALKRRKARRAEKKQAKLAAKAAAQAQPSEPTKPDDTVK